MDTSRGSHPLPRRVGCVLEAAVRRGLPGRNSHPRISHISESNFGRSPANPAKMDLKMKLQMKDEYSNAQQFRQLFVRNSLGLWRLVCPDNYCPGTEARAGCAQTRVKPSAVRPDGLSCTALFR